MDKETVIKIENVSKTFYVNEANNNSIRDKVFNLFKSDTGREIKALQNINLEIKRGEFFGIIGRNGSGKSTLLKLIMGAIMPDKGGRIEVKGKIIRLALGMGFDPNLSARDNIYVNASILGLTFKRIGLIFDDIIGFAELEKFVDTPVKFYSSGMRSRLSFSIAVHAEADIFLMDEFFGGVGDISFRKKSEEVFKETFLSGRTIINVSHQLPIIKKYCENVLVIDRGVPKIIGSPEEVLPLYRKLYKPKKNNIDSMNIKNK